MSKDLKLTKTENKKLRAFTMHGVTFHETKGSQAIGDCMFCQKDYHFYVNKENLLWDCKVCGKKGNLLIFLDLINTRNKKNLNAKVIRRLAIDRELPASAFDAWELGYYRNQYTLAVRGINGKVQDLRLFRIGQKVISTSQAKIGLMGLQSILDKPKDPVYVCEGEWDAIALRYLLQKAKAQGQVVCSPGANTFKPEWVDFFAQKKVYICYDNDRAGERGQETVSGRLSGIATSLRFLHWPEKNGMGYDIRDFVVSTYMKTKKPKATLQKLLGYMRSFVKGKEASEENDEVLKEAPTVDPSISIEDVFLAFSNKMHNPNRYAIELCFISLLSNMFGTNPLWYFLVAPPSAGKTEVINGFKYLCPPFDTLAHFTSNLTAHTLISGMKMARDPSLLALFENSPKTLFIKDLTTILSAPDNEKSEIFGQLRDAYDGYSSKDFGNGVKRRYNNLNFSIIAGVTHQIYDESVAFAALGERFAKCIVSPDKSIENQIKMMKKSMSNIGKETKLNDQVSTMVYSAVKNLIARVEKGSRKLPILPDWAQDQISGIAIYTAHMRGSVSRDKFRRDLIKSKPTIEFPTRFCGTLATTAIFRALLYGRKEVNQEDLVLVRKIALDTVNQRDEEILRRVYILNSSERGEATKRNVQASCSYTSFTVEQVLQDFVMVGILRIERRQRKLFYKFAPDMANILKSAHIYASRQELERFGIHCEELEKKPKRQSGRRKKKLIFKPNEKGEKNG